MVSMHPTHLNPELAPLARPGLVPIPTLTILTPGENDFDDKGLSFSHTDAFPKAGSSHPRTRGS